MCPINLCKHLCIMYTCVISAQHMHTHTRARTHTHTYTHTHSHSLSLFSLSVVKQTINCDDDNITAYNDTVMLCASDTVYTVLATCPITITGSHGATVNCSSTGGYHLLKSSSVIVNEVATCPDNMCLPLLPIDYDNSTL